MLSSERLSDASPEATDVAKAAMSGSGDRPESDFDNGHLTAGQICDQGIELGPGGVVAAGQHQEDRQCRDFSRDVCGQSKACAVGAMGIIYGDEQWAVG